MRRPTRDRVPPHGYEAWLEQLFGQPDEVDLFDVCLDAHFAGTDAELGRLFAYAMENSGRDLERFSDQQVANGLQLLVNSTVADNASRLRDGDIDRETRQAALLSMRHLYEDCLNPRCPPVLGHLSETAGSPLEFICYMLWDISPLGYWAKHKDADLGYACVIDVMRAALGCSNVACIESGLHGLGHTVGQRPALVESVIDQFMSSAPPDLRPELVTYAAAARRGAIQ